MQHVEKAVYLLDIRVFRELDVFLGLWGKKYLQHIKKELIS
jgi:hypothetical protein